MRYNLGGLSTCNFNLEELKAISTTNADILLAFYLHLRYRKKLADLHNAVDELYLDEYPTLNWSDYTIKEYGSKTLYSNFVCLNPNAKIKYLDVLNSSLPDKDKVTYLELVSICPPYSNEKFVPVTEVPRMLSIHGIVKAIEGGVLLIKER